MLQAEEAVGQEAAERLREDWRSRQGRGGAQPLHPCPWPPQALRHPPHPTPGSAGQHERAEIVTMQFS